MALTNLWYALVDQSNPVGFQVNHIEKLPRRSDDGLEQDLQVTTFAGFLILRQFLNYGYLNNPVIY